MSAFLLIISFIAAAGICAGMLLQTRSGKFKKTPKQPVKNFKNPNKFTMLLFSSPFCSKCDITEAAVSRTLTTKDKYSAVNFQVLDVNENRQLVEELQVGRIPAIVFINDNNIIGSVSGKLNDDQVEETLTEALAVQ